MTRFALLATILGCRYVPAASPAGDEPDAPAGDPVDVAPPTDTAELGEWGPPQRLDELASAQNDDDPSLTADLLEIYFCSTRTPVSADEDIYVARRASTTAPFDAPELVPDLNTSALESNVEVSPDGLTLVFTSDRDGNADLYLATRPDRASPWSAPAAMTGLNSNAGEWGAVVTVDRLHAVLCSDRSGDEAIYVADRSAADQPFGAPVKLAELDTAAQECDAMLPDPATIYFTRSMAAPADLDLFVAQRGANDAFGAPKRLTSLATAERDGDPWVSADQRTMVFASNRDSGNGTDDLYLTTR